MGFEEGFEEEFEGFEGFGGEFGVFEGVDRFEGLEEFERGLLVP